MATLERIGLVPAAGRAQRLGPLPCSKEIYPLALVTDTSGDVRPRTACEHLLEAMRLGGAEKAYVVVGDGKWDIPAYLGDGASVGIELAYLTIRSSPSATATVDKAFPFVRDALVLFGFPDIVFEPADVFSQLEERRAASGAAVVLGLFPTDCPEKVDTVDADADGRVRNIVIKEPESRLLLAWIVAVWGPEFTRFLRARAGGASMRQEREEYLGDVVREAIHAGIRVDSVTFPSGRFRDIGTPEDLRAAARDYD